MFQLLNTLYVLTQGAYLHLDHETLKLEHEGKILLQTPIHHIGGTVLFGNVMVSPFALHRLAQDGKTVVFLSGSGNFRARLSGPTSGNVLLRKEQYIASLDENKSLPIARNMVAGKIQNSRQVVMRAAREAGDPDDAGSLDSTAGSLADMLIILETADSLESVRGVEGMAAKCYFDTFSNMILHQREHFEFKSRSRRPPKDRINALLSFIYTLLVNDCTSAVESVGLDPQVGFLHAMRPGRPALALDLMEELRPIIADRLALNLINRQQIKHDDFEERAGGSVRMNDKSRKTLLTAYQNRKQEQVTHPELKRKMPIGLIPHIQARLLARRLRGDMDSYIPYMPR